MSNPTELPDLDRLEALAHAADPHGAGHLVTHYRLSANLKAEEAWRKAANPAAVLALIALARRAKPGSDRDKLLRIIAYTYQIAGAHGCPAHILDVLSDPEAATDEQVESLLPYQPEGEAPQAWNDRPTTEQCVTQSQAALVRLRDQHAESGARSHETIVREGSNLVCTACGTSAPGTPEAPADKDVARYQWLKERFTGYDFYWGGDPMAEREEDKGKCVIVFECGQDFRAGRDFEPAIDAAIKRAAQLDGGQGEGR